MIIKLPNLASSRREFLLNVFPAGTLFCLGCKGLLAMPCLNGTETPSGQKPKYLDDSGMNFEDVYKFTFGYCIPTYQVLAIEIGKERLFPILTKANVEAFSQALTSLAKKYPDRSMKSLASVMQTLLDTPPNNKVYQYETIENTDKVFELKFTECLSARVLREMNAAEIGYALTCSRIAAIPQSFNPKMRAENPKNLLKGDSVCIERYVLEA